MKRIYSIRAKKRIEKMKRIKSENNEALEVTYGNKITRTKILKHKSISKKTRQSKK